MDKNQILAIVKKHLVNTVEALEGVEIDPQRSMKEFGATSLDMVEIVSCSMRELKVKVPRVELNKLTNIDDLVTLLHQHVEQRQTAAPAGGR